MTYRQIIYKENFMLKKIIALALLAFTPFTLVANEVHRIEYPTLKTLSIEVPYNWENYNREIFEIESPNRTIEVTGRLFRGKGKTLKEFTQDKHKSIIRHISWYKPATTLSLLKSAPYPTYIKEYSGIWPEKTEPSTYVVTTLKVDNHYLSLTFTGLSKNIANKRKVINRIIHSVMLKELPQ